MKIKYALLALTLITTPVVAKDLEFCSAISNLANALMIERQKGESLVVVLEQLKPLADGQNVIKSPVGKLAIKTWEVPIGDTDAKKIEIIRAWRDLSVKKCLEME
jgi:hypothetical protein